MCICMLRIELAILEQVLDVLVQEGKLLQQIASRVQTFVVFLLQMARDS
jgi:hypothetical protein